MTERERELVDRLREPYWIRWARDFRVLLELRGGRIGVRGRRRHDDNAPSVASLAVEVGCAPATAYDRLRRQAAWDARNGGDPSA